MSIIYSAKIYIFFDNPKCFLIYFSIFCNFLANFNNFEYFCTKNQKMMENILSQNVRRICKERNLQMKELAARMDVDPAALTRALGGNCRLDTMQKMANALGVSLKSLFEPIDDVEGFIRIHDKVYQFNCRRELDALLAKDVEA